MRIFTNTLIAWPEVLHVFQAARLSTSRWQNYSFTHIQDLDSLTQSTHVKHYYCYERFRRKPELDYKISTPSIHTQQFPVDVKSSNILVIRHD